MFVQFRLFVLCRLLSLTFHSTTCGLFSWWFTAASFNSYWVENKRKHIILVYGKWNVEKTKLLFEVDNEWCSILVAANEDTWSEDFVKIILEDYGVDFAENDLELRYLLPKRNLHKQSINTPPVKIGNNRQFHAFLGLCKVENVRLCVSPTFWFQD